MAAPGRRDQQAASDSDWKYLKIHERDDALDPQKDISKNVN
jgi:hypothetical protein